MASNPGFVQYIADQCAGAGEITVKKMFGDYGISRKSCYGPMGIGVCSIDCSASRKALGESPVSRLKYLPKNEQYRTAIGWSYFANYQGQ